MHQPCLPDLAGVLFAPRLEIFRPCWCRGEILCEVGPYFRGMGRMELRHLRYFIAVAEEGSLTVAAEKRLHTAQPSLSRQMRDLELEIGATLFIRGARGIEDCGGSSVPRSFSNNRNVQRARPLGGSEQAKAISLASFSPSKILGTAGAARGLRLNTGSKPSSTSCLRTR
jgi:regulatory helix-turn-helix LysR family protein